MEGPGFVNDATAWWPGFVPQKITNKQEKHLFPPSSCKKQINKQNSYFLLAFLQSGSVPELDMHESKHLLPGPFVHSESGFAPANETKCIEGTIDE
jgi:hypothetical protein